jgi:hypothetical protein
VATLALQEIFGTSHVLPENLTIFGALILQNVRLQEEFRAKRRRSCPETAKSPPEPT